MLVDCDVRGQQGKYFSMQKVLLWIMDSYFGQKRTLKVKMPYWWICFCKNVQLFTSHDINWWTGFGLVGDYCDVFISCLYSHSDGTHWSPTGKQHLDGLSKFSFWGELFLKKQIKLGSLSGCMKVIHTDCVKHNTPTAMSSHTLSASGKWSIG